MPNLLLPSVEAFQNEIDKHHRAKMISDTNTYLKAKLGLSSNHHELPPIKQESLFKQLGFYFLTITGLIKHGLGSYLFALNLFSLIQGIPSLLLSIITLSYSLLDSFFFLAFEIDLLQKSLSLTTDIKNILIEELEQTSQLFNQLNNIQILTHLSISEYAQLNGLSSVFLKHLLNEHEQLNQRFHTPWMKILSYFLIGLGGISKLSSSYYFCQTFIKFFLPNLVGGLTASIFTAMIVLSSLGLYFSVNGTSIYQFMHKDLNTLKIFDQQLPKLQEQAQYHHQQYPKTLSLFRTHSCAKNRSSHEIKIR